MPWLSVCLSTLAAAQALDAHGIGGQDTVDKEVAEEALASHTGTEVDYAVNLWWRRF